MANDWPPVVKRILTALALWYDPQADRARHERVVTVTGRALRSAGRANRAVDAYRREQSALRRR